MLLLSLLKLNKRIQFALQILLLIIAAHTLLFVVVYGCNKLLQRNAKQTFSMSAIKPGARVVCMPMLAGCMRSKAGRVSQGTESAAAHSVKISQSAVAATNTQSAPTPSASAVVSNTQVRRVKARPIRAQKNKSQKAKQQEEKKGRKDSKKALSKAEQKKIARQQAQQEKAAKKKVAESKKVEQKIQPAAQASKPIEQVLATPVSTVNEVITGAVMANAVSPVVAESGIGNGNMTSTQDVILLDEDVIVVNTAAEMQAVHALQEMVVGLQTVWHPPIGFKPKRPLLVEVVGDKHGKLSVVSIKQSSGVLAYDLQAKNAIAQIEPIAGAADMRLVLEF